MIRACACLAAVVALMGCGTASDSSEGKTSDLRGIECREGTAGNSRVLLSIDLNGSNTASARLSFRGYTGLPDQTVPMTCTSNHYAPFGLKRTTWTCGLKGGSVYAPGYQATVEFDELSGASGSVRDHQKCKPDVKLAKLDCR
jgi:hypothetical protein